MKPAQDLLAYLKPFLDKYKYILLLAALGLALLLWPQPGLPAAESEPPAGDPRNDAAELESRLAAALSDIRGVGKARVVLTLQSGRETVFLYDRDRTASQGQGSYSETSRDSLVQSSGGPIVSRVNAPVFQGALIICQGADNPAVQFSVTQAVRALTGLPANNIVLSKMKS